jgi:hypothetical protein
MSEEYTTLHGLFINGIDLQKDGKYNIADIYNKCKESLGLEDEFSQNIYVFYTDDLEKKPENDESNLINNIDKLNLNDSDDSDDIMDVVVEEDNSIFISFLSNEIVNEVDEVDEKTKNNLVECLNHFIKKVYTCDKISYTVPTNLLETPITRYRLSEIIDAVTEEREEAEREEAERKEAEREKAERLKEEKKKDKHYINLEVNERKDAFYELEKRRGRYYDWFDRHGNIKKDIPPAKLREIKEQAEIHYYKYTKPKNKILKQERIDENIKINEQLAARAREASNTVWAQPYGPWQSIVNNAMMRNGGKKKSKKSKKSKKVNKSKKSKKSKK